MKTKEFIKKFNSAEILQTTGFDGDFEDVSEELSSILRDSKLVAEYLDIDKHRWYELVTDVYKLEDGFVGIRFIGHLFSEMSDFEDIYHTLKAFEMEEVTTLSYRPIETD